MSQLSDGMPEVVSMDAPAPAAPDAEAAPEIEAAPTEVEAADVPEIAEIPDDAAEQAPAEADEADPAEPATTGEFDPQAAFSTLTQRIQSLTEQLAAAKGEAAPAAPESPARPAAPQYARLNEFAAKFRAHAEAKAAGRESDLDPFVEFEGVAAALIEVGDRLASFEGAAQQQAAQGEAAQAWAAAREAYPGVDVEGVWAAALAETATDAGVDPANVPPEQVATIRNIATKRFRDRAAAAAKGKPAAPRPAPPAPAPARRPAPPAPPVNRGAARVTPAGVPAGPPAPRQLSAAEKATRVAGRVEDWDL